MRLNPLGDAAVRPMHHDILRMTPPSLFPLLSTVGSEIQIVEGVEIHPFALMSLFQLGHSLVTGTAGTERSTQRHP